MEKDKVDKTKDGKTQIYMKPEIFDLGRLVPLTGGQASAVKGVQSGENDGQPTRKLV